MENQHHPHKDFWSITEVIEFFRIDETFLLDLECEEIVCPLCHEGSPDKLFPFEEIEKLRIAKILVEEMGVNLAGVEVILRMRQSMIEMRRQFDDILEDLAKHLGKKL